jgi:hypothetical protein
MAKPRTDRPESMRAIITQPRRPTKVAFALMAGP